jgi:dTDP-4-dehydrorhamnose 3,5-epimerase
VNQLKKDDVRGNHAHLKLEQFIFLLDGAITIKIEDGIKSKNIDMEADNVGLYLAPMIWRSIIAKQDMTSFVVLASLEFSENDYIRNYEDFMQNYARSN